MHVMRETNEDKDNQTVILDTLSAHLKCQYTQVETLGKYKIDGWLHSGKNTNVLGFVECKWYGKIGFYGLNLPKYIEGCLLAQYARVPFYYAIRVPGGDGRNRFGFITLHDGLWSPSDPVSITHTGGTQKGRQPNWDDVEPMVMLNKDDIQDISYGLNLQN